MRNSVLNHATLGDVLRIAAVTTDRRGFFLCPVHADEHPSAHVVPGGLGWRCFACGAHGGVLDAAIAFGLADSRPEAASFLEARVPCP